MMKVETIEALRRLTKGKYALSPEQLRQFHRDLTNAAEQDVLDAVAKKSPAKKKPSPDKPAWLLKMDVDSKRIKWKAAEAAKALVQLAIDDGLIADDFFSSLSRPPTFGAAAKKIAKVTDPNRLAALFEREVRRIEREYSLG